MTCTPGQQCVAGKCVDLCDVRQQAGLAACPDNFVCQNGACVPNCTCLACPDSSLECQSDSTKPGFGRCVASGCSGVTCPAGQLCYPGGNCQDPCASNTCGANQTCVPSTNYNASSDRQYSCQNPNGTTDTGGTSGNGTGGLCLGSNCNPTNGGNNSGVGGNGALPPGPASSTGSMGCGCRVGYGALGGWAVAGIAGLALMASRRRRRR